MKKNKKEKNFKIQSHWNMKNKLESNMNDEADLYDNENLDWGDDEF